MKFTKKTTKEGTKLYHDNKMVFFKGSEGTKEWYLNGNLHREDGPAFESADGSKEWWVNDVRIEKNETEEVFIAQSLEEAIKLIDN